MAKKRSKKKKTRTTGPPSAPRKTAEAAPSAEAPEAKPAIAWAIFAWGFLVHLVYLLDGSVTGFFVGDGGYFLIKARHLVEGTSPDAGLPFHPPLTSWLLAPFWWLGSPEGAGPVLTAGKVVMAAANATTYAVLFFLLRPRVRYVTLFLALLPLSFGELLLSATPNSEAIYRLLLAVLLFLGFRRPLVGGVLHGLAALARAEHFVFGLFLLAVGLARPERRRFAALTAAAAFAVVLPYTVAVSADLRAYNAEHAETLPEPLPTLVPVSFYGPLNFALAQTEDGIHFSRFNLPVSQNEAAALDPNHPVHNDYIVHGYRIGLAAIWDDPARFVRRSLAKVGHSLRAFTYGWTWRDLPKGKQWKRQPVDMPLATAPVYEVVVGAFALAGIWHLRRDRRLLAVGLGLVAYRLAINVAFFPYLRSMMIAGPFVLLLAFTSLTRLFKHLTPYVLGAVWLGLALFHLLSGFGERRYLQQGERDARGQVIDDRPVVLIYDGGGS